MFSFPCNSFWIWAQHPCLQSIDGPKWYPHNPKITHRLPYTANTLRRNYVSQIKCNNKWLILIKMFILLDLSFRDFLWLIKRDSNSCSFLENKQKSITTENLTSAHSLKSLLTNAHKHIHTGFVIHPKRSDQYWLGRLRDLFSWLERSITNFALS